MQAHKEAPPAVVEQPRKEIVSETVEPLPVMSEASVEVYNTDSKAWEASKLERTVPTTTKEEHQEDQVVDKVNGPGH